MLRTRGASKREPPDVVEKEDSSRKKAECTKQNAPCILVGGAGTDCRAHRVLLFALGQQHSSCLVLLVQLLLLILGLPQSQLRPKIANKALGFDKFRHTEHRASHCVTTSFWGHQSWTRDNFPAAAEDHSSQACTRLARGSAAGNTPEALQEFASTYHRSTVE